MDKKVKMGRPNRLLVALLSLFIVAAIASGTVFITEYWGSIKSTIFSSQGTTSKVGGDSTQSSGNGEIKDNKTYTATVAATGDLLIHESVFKAAKQSDGTYNFDSMFQHISSYISKADYAVANLETTLAGTELGYSYSGYPCFNTPDALVDSVKKSGFDMLLTANNHSYDTRYKGMLRTLEVIDQSGLDRLGINKDTTEKKYVVKEINNIKIGMVCYTYETDTSKDAVALNGIPLSDDATKLVNAFSYSELDTFYQNMEKHIADMKNDGAEAIMLFIHWGDEYHTEENKTQQTIAQKMCDLGVDVIVGGHPHMVQPVDLISSTVDQNHKTVCLYSMGDTLCNIPNSKNGKEPGYCLDGVLFNVTFEKKNGVVSVKSADILPLYCNIYYSNSKGMNDYEIIPLDENVDNWQATFNLSDTTLAECKRSIERTTEIVKEGLEKVNKYLADPSSYKEEN